MTDDEEKQLRQELLAVKLSLKRKQEFWETPRNLAILVGVTAAIAAAIGFWLGRESAGPPAPIARPVASFWDFGDSAQRRTDRRYPDRRHPRHRRDADLCRGPAGASANVGRRENSEVAG